MPIGYFYKKEFTLRKILKISGRVLLVLLALVLLLYGLLQTEWGQNVLARQITKKLSRELQTKVSIKHVRINLFNFNKMNLEGVLLEDQKHDTLLYAGNFQVRITDWFFFKDKAELKYIGLEDATINLSRTDSVWNYHFLEEYFASSDTSTKKKSGIEFDLKKVVMKNVSFVKKDAWTGSDMIVRVGALDMDAREISLTGKRVDVSNLVLNDPYFQMRSYTGNNGDTLSIKSSDAPVKKTAGGGWAIAFSNIKITNGRFRDDKGTEATSLTYFDGKHIDFSKINADFKNIGWTRDTITGNIELSAVERSGLVIKTLKAKTTIHPQAMIFDNLDLQTNKSRLGSYFAMRYDQIGDMSDFLHSVVMEARFKKAEISSDDIAFFAPAMKSWKRAIRIDGDVRGAVDALTSKDLEIWAGNNTYIHGAVSLIGLPRISETLINVEAEDLRTTYNDAVSFIPAIRNIQTPDLKKLSYLRFKGTYTGFVNDFVTYGTLQTNLGTLQTDLNMKFPQGGEPVYAGRISTAGFELGSFINSPQLGSVAFKGSVKGKGFRWQTLDMNIDGVVNKLQYGNYNYQNITAKGDLTNRLFNGEITVKDPNADLHMKGLVDLTGKKPRFNVTASIAYAKLKPLQITNEDIELSGDFDLDLEASSLSDLTGTARIMNGSLISNGRPLSFDSLVVSSSYVDGLKRLRAVSNEFDATITGDFDLKGLPDAFTAFLSRYYPSYIRPPRYVKPQVFTFDITTGIVEDYVKLIHPRLSGFNNSHITGSLNTAANTMTVDADVPHFGFRQYDFSDVQLKGSGDLEKLILTGDVSNAQIGDSVFFPQTSFSIQAQNDISDIKVNTSSNQAINSANIAARVKTFSDGATVTFDPSTFVLNSKTWTIEQGGELNFRKNSVVQGEVVLRESNQLIRLWTEPDALGSWNNLRVSWENINLGDISPLISKKNHFEGLVSGEATVEDPTSRMNVSGQFNASELRIDNDSIGGFRGTINYNNKTGILTAKASNTDPEHRIDLDVAMNLKDSANNFTDKIGAKLTNFQLKYLNRFLGTIFSDLDGYVSGNLDITGEGPNMEFTSKARITGASFKVNFTQVKYWIDDTDFEMTKDRIKLDGIRIRDRNNHTALVKGYISHHRFQDMYYDIAVQTESDRMELLNTNYHDNQQFYGRAKGSGTFVLVGPQSDMLMDIDVKASENPADSSYITLPPSRSRESGQASFMVEKKYGREMTPQSLGLTTNLHYDVRLAANPNVNIEVILDELTGDAISGKGTGNLHITSGTSEPLSIIGRYDIEEGSYNFTFQSFLKKPFVLKKGGNNYIDWSGDPYGANIHLDATYKATNVSFSPLATGSGLFDTKLAGERGDVTVAATLTGNLFHPDFDFKLEFPPGDITNNPEFQFLQQQIQKNPNELYKQVTYLIVFNSFAPFENSTVAGYNPFGEFTYSTLSGLLFGKVNEQLNRILSKILQNNNATLSLTGSLYNRNVLNQNGGFQLPNSLTNLSLALPLFDGRAHFTVGATLNVPLQDNIQQTIGLYPDVTLELLINKTGSVRATFFYRQNVDFIGATSRSSARTRYGASIGYGRDFDNLRDLFRRNKPPKAKKDTARKVDSVGTN